MAARLCGSRLGTWRRATSATDSTDKRGVKQLHSASVTVFGAGYVGLITGACLARSGHNVVLVDTDPARIETLESGGLPIHETGLEALLSDGARSGSLRFATALGNDDLGDFLYVAVGTPMAHGGGADLRYVRAVVETILASGRAGSVVIMKSTVPPGTGERLAAKLSGRGIAYVSNPEFLREGRRCTTSCTRIAS